MWLYVSLQERNIQALGAVWTKSQYLNNWAYKISKNKTNLYSACREITEPGPLWSQGQLLILALISHRGTMPPRYFCKADWHNGIPAQLTAMMDGAPAPAPPGCQLAQKPYIHMWNSTILCTSLNTSSHLPYATKRLQPRAKLILISKSVHLCLHNPGSQIIAPLRVHYRGRFWHAGWILCLHARLDALPHP